MTEQAPHSDTLPPSAASDAASAPTPTSPTPSAPAAGTEGRGRRRSRIAEVYTGLIAGAVLLVLVLIFIIENAHAVTITYFGAHLRLSLAVALLLAAIGGALVMAAAGTARITQLRLSMRRGRRQPHEG